VKRSSEKPNARASERDASAHPEVKMAKVWGLKRPCRLLVFTAVLAILAGKKAFLMDGEI
jgi:hypothetical protein